MGHDRATRDGAAQDERVSRDYVDSATSRTRRRTDRDVGLAVTVLIAARIDRPSEGRATRHIDDRRRDRVRGAVDQVQRTVGTGTRETGRADGEVRNSVTGQVADRGQRVTEQSAARERGRSSRPQRRYSAAGREVRARNTVDAASIAVEARRTDEQILIAVAILIAGADQRAAEPVARRPVDRPQQLL